MSTWPPPDAVTWPTVDDYKTWARIADNVDDELIATALGAATAAVKERCTNIPVDGGDVCPADVAQAVLLWANRLFARRNSPTGVVGIDETGQAILPGKDPDIVRLISPWIAPVLA